MLLWWNGRHAGFKTRFRKKWEFESLWEHGNFKERQFFKIISVLMIHWLPSARIFICPLSNSSRSLRVKHLARGREKVSSSLTYCTKLLQSWRYSMIMDSSNYKRTLIKYKFLKSLLKHFEGFSCGLKVRNLVAIFTLPINGLNSLMVE